MRLVAKLVDLEGNRTPLDIEPDLFGCLRGSSDGQTILYSTAYPTSSAIALLDPSRGVSRPQVRDGHGYQAIWGPDPGSITYDRTDDDGRRRIAHKPLGGSRADETEIPVPDGVPLSVAAWSSDGEVLLAVDSKEDRIMTYTVASGWELVSGTGEGDLRHPTFSPDARWLAFVSDESGQSEVLVRPFGRPGGSEQVSVGGGFAPIWSDDGRHIYYRYRGDDPDDQWIMAVDVTEADARLEFSRPRKLFRDEFNATTPIRQWDMLGPDRFLLVQHEDEAQQRSTYEGPHPDRLIYIQNWASRVDGEN